MSAFFESLNPAPCACEISPYIRESVYSEIFPQRPYTVLLWAHPARTEPTV